MEYLAKSTMMQTTHPALLLFEIKIILVLRNDRMKVRSIGTYLNRLLSFSSSSAVSNEGSFQLPQSSENGILDAFNTDYFFHDDTPDGDTGDGMNSIFEVAHPNSMAKENKNSSSNLVRRKSFTNRNRGVANGRQ